MFDQKNRVGVLVVSASEKSVEYIRDLLPQNRFFPITSVSSAGEAKRILSNSAIDIVIINTPLNDDFGIQLAIDINDNISVGILVLVKNDLYEQVEYKLEDYGILTLSRPINRQYFLQSVKLLSALKSKLKFLEKKAASLEVKMKEVRLINRAKLLLIQNLSMSESDAHRYIEKTAMDKCIKKEEVAKSIIRTYEN